MKRTAFLLVVLACLLAGTAFADDHCALNFSCDKPVRFADRHDGDDTRFAITTEDRKVVLLLTDRVVAMQLSDRTLHKVDRKMRDASEDDDSSVLGQAIRTAVFASVKSMLDHSAECDLRDLASTDYRHGEIILTTRSGKHVFRSAEIDDEHVMGRFDESDARAFVREVRRQMARAR